MILNYEIRFTFGEIASLSSPSGGNNTELVVIVRGKDDDEIPPSGRNDRALENREREKRKAGKARLSFLPPYIPNDACHSDAQRGISFLPPSSFHTIQCVIPTRARTERSDLTEGKSNFFKNTGRPKDDPKYKWASGYMDLTNDPLYPFGFGLSYTSFSYSDIRLSNTQMKMNDSITISVTVKNTGRYTGEEVVQLYIRDLVGSVTRPVKELKGFRKVLIKTGESKEVTFTLRSSDLAFYTKDMTFKAEPGDFKVFVGTNSVDYREASFTLID